MVKKMSVALLLAVAMAYGSTRESPWSNEPLIQAAYRDDAEGVERMSRLLREGADVQVRSESGYTALMAAANAGNVEAVRLLLQAGADCRVRTNQASSVLHSLARADLRYCTGCRGMSGGDVEAAWRKLEERLVLIADMLIKAGAEVDAVDAEGLTPIWIAMLRYPRLVQKLLEAGANPNGCVGQGDMKMSLLMAAAHLRKPKVAAALLAAGAEADGRCTDNGRTPLHYAVLSGRRVGERDDAARNEVVRLLLEYGANPLAADAAGWTAFRVAVGRPDAELVSLLASYCRDGIDTPGDMGRTLLMVAVRYVPMPGVKALLEAGANVNARDAQGLSVLALAVQSERDDAAAVVAALLEVGADFSGKAQQQVMWHAAQFGRAEVVQLLLDRGAEVNLPLEYGNTMLHGAVDNAQPGVVELLLRAGADVNRQNNRGLSPLHWAVQDKGDGTRGRAAELLIRAGANLHLPDAYGRTPLQLAFPELMKKLGLE